MASLPADCLVEIFQYFKQDNYRTHDLHSCILVNRLWCDTAVPILWKNPIGIGLEFKENLIDSCIPRTNEFWLRFARTIFSCLPIESKELIKQNNIRLKVKLSDSSTFNYVGFVQYLSYRIILRCIREIIDSNDSTCYNENLLENEIWMMFMSKGSIIKYLEPAYIPIYYFTGGIDRLRYLTELECSSNLPPKFYFDLAQFCRNLQRISIEFGPDDNPGLFSLIELQNELKEIRILPIKENTYVQLGETISKQADTLTTLCFIDFMCIPADSLNQLVNIKKLEISFHYGYCFKKLHYINLPKLEVLKIQGGNERHYDEISLFRKYAQIIEKTQKTLREIFVDIDEGTEEEENMTIFTKSLIKNCPMLEGVKIWVIDGYFEVIEELIISCVHLKKLTVEATSITGSWNSTEANPLFNILVDKAKNLNELFLNGSFNFSLEDLIKFFENWKGKEKLYIIFGYNPNLTQEYFEICKSFKSKGVLRDWKILKENYDDDNRNRNQHDLIESDTQSQSDDFDIDYW